MKKKTKKRTPKLSPENEARREAVLNAILANNPIYLKDTGIQIKLRNMHETLTPSSKSLNARFYVNVEVVGAASIKALNLFRDYGIADANNFTANAGNHIRITGTVGFDSISVNPFDTAAAATLYGKK